MLKSNAWTLVAICRECFSTLQRVEIAEIDGVEDGERVGVRVSVLFNESKLLKSESNLESTPIDQVSVLFNESKLLKFPTPPMAAIGRSGFSTLQRVEIAEILTLYASTGSPIAFQYSSTSRNC